MKFRRDFLLAVYAFAEGGEGATFEDALMRINPTAEEMQWVLEIYHAPHETLESASADIPTFITALADLLDKIQTGAAPATTIATTNKPDSRGDQGMRTRQKKELGMGAWDEDERRRRPERSGGRILYYNLINSGWLPFTTYAKNMSRSANRNSEFFNEIQKIAEQHSLQQGLCSFPRGTHTYVMLSPELIDVCKQYISPSPDLLPMQPNERAISTLTAHGNTAFRLLIHAMTEYMSEEKISPELAIVYRKSRSKKTECLTPIFQSALEELGLIKIKSPNVGVAVGTFIDKIPTDDAGLTKLAHVICKMLLSKKAKQDVASPSANAGQIASAARPTDIEFDGLGLA